MLGFQIGLFTLNSQMGERSAQRGRPAKVGRPYAAEVGKPHAAEVGIPHAAEVSRIHQVEVSRPRPVELSSSTSGFDYVWPQTSECHNSFIRTLIRMFLDSMESPFSQEYIHMP